MKTFLCGDIFFADAFANRIHNYSLKQDLVISADIFLKDTFGYL